MERDKEKWEDIGDVGNAEQTSGDIISFCTILYLVLSHYFSTYLSLYLIAYDIYIERERERCNSGQSKET